MDRSAKKICVITTVHPAFDTRIFHKEIKSLLRAGYNVSLIATHDKDENLDGVEIKSLPAWRGRLKRLANSIKALKLARSEDFDAYHFHDPEFLPFSVLLSRLTGKPVIFDVHEDYPNSIRDKYWIPRPLRNVVARLYEIVEGVCLRFIDVVVYTTPIVGRRYPGAKKKVRIENYPPVEIFMDVLPQESKEMRFVFTGTISRIRGIFVLAEAFRLTNLKYPEAKLVLVGWFRPPKLEDEIRGLFKEWGMEDSVEILPGIPHQEMGRFLAGSLGGMVTFLPFGGHTSHLPIKIFEYMASGIPVIASDFPLYREVIAGSKCGILVNQDRPQEIADAMMSLIKDRGSALEMGRRGRKAFEDKYNWNSEGEKLVKLYDGLFGRLQSKEAPLR